MSDTSPCVEVILSHYKRPGNLVPILEALRRQSAACRITLVDSHPAPQFAPPATALELTDRVIRLSHNYGPFCRYVAALGYGCQFTLLLDDDMVPGIRVVEHFLAAAVMRPRFGVLGQLGRICPAGRYRRDEVARGGEFLEVDVVVRAYFVRTSSLVHLHRLLWEWPGGPEQNQHDDLMLAVAVRCFGGLPIFLTPADPDPETRLDKEPLPSPYALCSRPDHDETRSAFLALGRRLGWRSVADGKGTD